MKYATYLQGAGIAAVAIAAQAVILMIALGCSPDLSIPQDTAAFQKRIEAQYLEIKAQRTLATNDRGKKLQEMEFQYAIGDLSIAEKTLARAKTALSQATPVAVNHAVALLETAEEIVGHTQTYIEEKGLK